MAEASAPASTTPRERSPPREAREPSPGRRSPPAAAAGAGSSSGELPIRRGPPDISAMYSLKIDNLSYRTRPPDLQGEFSHFGEVGDIFIPRDRMTGDSRGFAFVRFRQKGDAERAMEGLNGKEIDGRAIRIEFAKYGRPEGNTALPPKPRSPPPRRSHSPRRSRSRSRSRSPRRRAPSPRRETREPEPDRRERVGYERRDRDRVDDRAPAPISSRAAPDRAEAPRERDPPRERERERYPEPPRARPESPPHASGGYRRRSPSPR